VYCLPLSVSISFGAPWIATACRYTSSTDSDVCRRNTSSPTMYLEWSSMNPIRYAYSPPSLNGKMSLCHSWFGVERSKNRGFEGFFGTRTFTGGTSFASCSARLTAFGLAGSRWNRLSIAASRRDPKIGFSFLSSTAFSATIRWIACRSRSLGGRPVGWFTRATSPCLR